MENAVYWGTRGVDRGHRRGGLLGLRALLAVTVVSGLMGSVVEGQTIQYLIGEPTAEEQLGLELINRARANPAAEGIRLAAQAVEDVSVLSDTSYFGTNLTTMQNELAAIAPTQPLSFNANLITIARTHNDNMLASNTQTHYSTSDPRHYWNRMDNGGYVWSQAGENIFATALDMEEAHASFEIDWGSGSGGMQNGRGHRTAIHNEAFREIGIGYLEASASNVGPFLVTQNFGERISRATIKPYITGVAIHDADGDGFYDIGEGIEGVTVTVKDLSTDQFEDHYAVTCGSGGYSVPVDGGAGDYEVKFELPGGTVETYTVTVTSEFIAQYNWERGFNVKADLVLAEAATPTYTPPVILNEAQVAEGSTTVVDFVDVEGAQEYEVLVAEALDSPQEQDADAAAPVTLDKSSSYSHLNQPSHHGDRWAFHLTHPSSSSGHQSLTLDRDFVPGPAGAVSFDSRLRNTGTAQIAILQVTADGGRNWKDMWYLRNSFSTATGFTRVTVDVSEFEGQPIKFRFFLYLGAGTVEYGTGSNRGWHFDDIGFADMVELVNRIDASVAASEYLFTPTLTGDCHLQVRSRAGDDFTRYADSSIFEVTTNDYAGWATRKETSAGLPAGTLADSDSDYDGDGLSQLAEYALEASGLDPLTADPADVPGAAIEGNALCVHYTVDTSLTDVEIVVEASTDLNNWYTPGQPGAPAGFVDTPDGVPAGTLEARTAEIPADGHENLFMRIRVTEIPES